MWQQQLTAVDAVISAPDDGWGNHPQHVEQFTDKINCVQLYLVGHLLTLNSDARSHEHENKILKNTN